MALHFAARRAITRQLRASARDIAVAVTEEFLACHPDWLERRARPYARPRGRPLPHRTTVRHQAYDVLMYSRAAPEWLGSPD